MAVLTVIWWAAAVGGLLACLLAVAFKQRRSELLLLGGLCFAIAGVLGILSIGIVFLVAAAALVAMATSIDNKPADVASERRRVPRRRSRARVASLAAVLVMVGGAAVVFALRANDSSPDTVVAGADDPSKPEDDAPIPDADAADAEPTASSLPVPDPQPTTTAPIAEPYYSSIGQAPPQIVPYTPSNAIEAAVADAVYRAFGGTQYEADRAAFEAADELGETFDEGAELYPQHAEGLSAIVYVVTVLSDTEAEAVFDVIDDGLTVTATTRGRVVLIDGIWVISRDTICEMMSRGGIRCPGQDGSSGWASGPDSGATLVFDPTSVSTGAIVHFAFDPGALVDTAVMGDDMVMRLLDNPEIRVQHSGVFTEAPIASLGASEINNDGWPVTGLGTMIIPSAAEPGTYHVEFVDHPELHGLLTVSAWGSEVSITLDSVIAAARLLVVGTFTPTEPRPVPINSTSPAAERWAFEFAVDDVSWYGADAAEYDPEDAETIEVVVTTELAHVLEIEITEDQPWAVALGGMETGEGLMATPVLGAAGIFRVLDDDILESLDSRVDNSTYADLVTRLQAR